MVRCDISNNVVSNSKYKILIIEDSQFINNTINRILGKMGYKCDQAMDYAAASFKLQNSEYDFIILDLNLPDAQGQELVQNVKRLTNAKIIILTSETDIQSRENFFKSGILDYLVKDKYFDNSINSIDQIIHSIEKNYMSNILLIDDSKLIRRYIDSILKVRNYNVETAENAQEGLRFLKKNETNVIILDMELPDMHGLDVIRSIKEKPELSQLPIIVISSNNDPEIVRSCLKLGATDFIHKPFNVEEFVLKVDLAVVSNRKDREILCKQKLLQEYKEAVDRSTIVTKINLKGEIVYVNDKFCNISGYTENEYVGKLYKIDDYDFESLRNYIIDKGAWRGVVKSIAKNGETYYVDTVVNPISDSDGNLTECIAIGTDVTEQEIMKDHLQNELNISKGNFKDMYKLSSEYEKAIDMSTILSRADINGDITYVNKAFCDIFGYTEEELIGKSHRILKHSKNKKEIYKGLWDTITSGKVWNGQLINRAKDGSEYYVDTTIIPIMDADNNIIEYMATRHDVTETIKLHIELEETQKEIIYKMGEVGETRSKETGFHVKRVAEYSKLLALLAGLGEKNAELLYSASPMHDIGKVGIPDNILKKPGKLDAEEWRIMQTHSELGYSILKNSKRPILKAASVVAYRHHEKWDGSGYPNGLAGEKIHIFGRITAIADVFDALGSDRCYKEAWELEKILELFKEERGKHFDPKLVDLFLGKIDEFLKIRDMFKDIKQIE